MATADQQLAAYYNQLAAEELAAHEATRSRTGGEVARDLGVQALGGAVTLGQGVYGLANMATLGLLDRGLGMSENFDRTQQILHGARSAPLQRDLAQAQAAFDRGIAPGLGAYVTNPALLGDLAVTTLPSLLAPMAAARYAGARVAGSLGEAATTAAGRATIAQRATQASLLGGSAYAGGVSNVEGINVVRDAGGDENLQQAAGLLSGAIVGPATYGISRLTGAGALEAAVANRLMGGAARDAFEAGTGGLVRGFAGGATKEAFDEALQGSTEHVASRLLAPGVSVTEGLGQTAALGALAGGMLGGPLGAYSSGPRRKTPLREQGDELLRESVGKVGVDQRPLSVRLDMPLAQVEEIDAAPEEVVLGEDSLPTQTEFDQLLAQLQGVADAPPTPPVMQVEEVDAAPLGGLPLPQVEELGVSHEPLPTMQVADVTPAEVTTGWRQFLARDLGVTPRQLSGKAWKRFTEAATEANVVPGSPEAEQFLQAMAVELAADEATASNFAAALGTKYTPAQPTVDADAELARSIEAGAAQGRERARERAFVWTQTRTRALQDGAAEGGMPKGRFRKLLTDFDGVATEEDFNRVSAQLPGDTPMTDAQFAAYTAASDAALDRALRNRPLADMSHLVRRYARMDLQAALETGDAEWATDSAKVLAELGEMPTDTPAQITAPPAANDAVSLSVVPAGAAPTPAENVSTEPATATPPETAVAPDPTPAEELDPDTAKVEARIQARAKAVAGTLRNRADAPAVAMNDMLTESRSAAEVAEAYGAMKDTPAFAALTPEQQQVLTDTFAHLYEGYSTPGRYYRAGEPAKAGKGIHPVQLRQLVERTNARRAGKPPIVLHDTVEAFTEATGIPAPADVAGVFAEDGTIHVIASNIRDRSHAGEVIFHERAHEGLGGLLGTRLPAVLNRLQANAAIRTRIRNKADRNGLSRALAAEEVLVDMIVSGEKLTGDVWGKIRNAVRTGLDTALGISDLTVSDAQVDRLLKDTAAFMRGRPVAGSDGLLDDGKWLTIDRLLDDPGVLEGVPRYSRAMDHLDEVVDRAANQTPEDFGDAAKGAVESATGTLRGALSATWDKARRLAMDAMPLNWIEEHYAKFFGGATVADNPLRRFVRHKSDKEADFNQNLTRDRAVTYQGPNGAETFTTSPMSLSKAWEGMSRSNRPAFDNLNTLMQHASYYKVWPDRGWGRQSAVDYNSAGFTEADRKAAHEKLQRLWGRTGTEARNIFKQSQAIYDQLWNRRFAALSRELAKTAGLQVDENGRVAEADMPQFRELVGNRIDNALKQLKAGPYSPLSRYGDYFVTVRDGKGKTVWFSAYDSEAEAKAAENNLFSSLTPEQQTQYSLAVSLREEFQRAVDGIDHRLISRLEENAATLVPPGADGDDATTAAFRKSLRDALVETYLASVPGHSLMNHANARSGVEGFNQDAFRAFNDYAIKAARNVSSVGFDGEISRDLVAMGQAMRDASTGQGTRANTVQMGRVLNAVRRQHTASMNSDRSGGADFLSQASSLMYMTSPSQMLVNALQTPMVTLPRLAGIYGSAPAMRAVREGMTKFFAGGKRDFLHPDADIDPRVREVINRLRDSGELDFTLVHDIARLAEGDYSHMSARKRVMMEWAFKAIHASEVFNRQVTAYAAAKLEIEKGNTDADAIIEAARRAIKTTHFDYSTANKATIMQGPYRRLVFQFQQHRLNMLAMMGKDIKDWSVGTPEEKAIARRTIAWMLGTQLAFTGATGTVMAPIVFALLDMFRDDDDLLDSRTDFIRGHNEILTHGLLGGVLDLGRVDTGSLLPLIGDRAYAPKDASGAETAAYYLTRNIGPWAGFLSGVMFEGPQKVVSGDFKGAARAFLPKPFADVVATMQDADGAKTAQGIVYYDPGVWDNTLNLLGLRSGDRRAAEELRGAGYQANKHANVVRQRYLTRMAVGASTGDTEMMTDAQADIARWNASNPDYAIRAQDIRGATRNRYRTEATAAEHGIVTGRRVGPTLVDTLNLQR